MAPETEDGLRKLARRAPELVLELGSWRGKSARHIVDSAPAVHLVCVDTWLCDAELLAMGNTHDGVYDEFLSNLWDVRSRVTPIRTDTVSGLALLAARRVPVDLVYVDAGHLYPAVLADLLAARELFPAATLCGDDADHPGVLRALREVLPSAGRDGRFWWWGA